jgi:hypothetical protein
MFGVFMTSGTRGLGPFRGNIPNIEKYCLPKCDALRLVRTDVSEEMVVSIIWAKRITPLGTTVAVSPVASYC